MKLVLSSTPAPEAEKSTFVTTPETAVELPIIRSVDPWSPECPSRLHQALDVLDPAWYCQ